MKKVFVILLTLIYGLSSSGMYISVHYCCGKFDKISFSQKFDDAGKTGKTISKKGCCDNKDVQLKLKGDQESRTIKQASVTIYQGLADLPYTVTSYFVCKQKPVNEYPTGPPLFACLQDKYILHSVFRI